MVETKSMTITLPGSVWSGAIALAEKQKVSLDAVVRDAIVRYGRMALWDELKSYGRERFAASGYREEDVVRLCRETRAELASGHLADPEAKTGV